MASPEPVERPPATSLTAARRPDDIIKIMLATDNHIGYLERDPVRGQDAIDTFEEILKLAVKYDVDFILLAGDLFHENRPSREVLFRTMALLREHTLSDKPVQVELLSNPDEGKTDGFKFVPAIGIVYPDTEMVLPSFPAINYEDPNLNVGIPVFSIHGNHDDPQGAGHEGALCALDLLSVAGLINYIGKIDLSSDQKDSNTDSGGIKVKPVLLRKGNTRLALYGMGNIKDQRMHYELRTNRVRMYVPRSEDDWFNILLLHQNRAKRGPQEYVPEGMFDDSINLVVWGHEHDCRIEPEEVPGKPYFITQPGSSVATSLSDGESIPKQVAFLEIQGKEFQMTPIPLRTVRPFVMEELIMTEEAEEHGFSLTDKMEINKFLRSRVEALIQRAATEYAERQNEHAGGEDEEDGVAPPKEMLPLVRLKVDTTGVPEMSNPIRFGQEFQGRVANPKDLLVFTRQKKSAQKAVKIDKPELSIDDPDLSTQNKLARVRFAQLVEEYLGAQELQLLGENGMGDAIQMYVDKDDSTAIKEYVAKSLTTILHDVAAKEVHEDDVDDALGAAKDVAEAQFKVKAEKRAKAKEKAKEKEKPDQMEVDSMDEHDDGRGAKGDDDDEFSEEEEPAPPKKKAAAKAPAKAKATKASTSKAAPKKAPAKKGKTLFISSDEDPLQNDDIEDDDDDDIPPPPRKGGRAAVLNTISKAPPKKKTTTVTKAPAKRATTSRSAAKAASSKMQEIEISDDDD
ncbi:meiotic recombination [Tulasnella sp. 424]|nr:meiotic recombination [Tulasnella sp. 424]KAG8971157.1 meiotic recombination [Tulasnella sp. 425]